MSSSCASATSLRPTSNWLRELIACYGLFMAPVGWTYTIYIWIYATVWFVFNDFLKVAVYRMLNKTAWLLGHDHFLDAVDGE